MRQTVAVGVIKSVEKSDKGKHLSNPFAVHSLTISSWQGHQGSREGWRQEINGFMTVSSVFRPSVSI
jgi:hypothetical protein